MTQRAATLHLALCLTLLAAGCLAATPTGDDVPAGGAGGAPPGTVALPGATVETPHGAFTLVLYPDLAPRTVAQFTGLAARGWYNGSVFHRTVDNFVIQGGAPAQGREPADAVPREPGGHFAAGTVGLARDLDPDSGTSQFFVTEYPQAHLHDASPTQSAGGFAYGNFTAFGQVVAGMDAVRAIAALPHDGSGQDRPRDPPPMRVTPTTVHLPEGAAAELPYRVWDREEAPPYRVSLESPGTLPVGKETWLRVTIENRLDRTEETNVALAAEVTHDETGHDVAAEVTSHPADGNVHTVRLAFEHAGAHTVALHDGVRLLAAFDIAVG